jgi:hypothetical protein
MTRRFLIEADGATVACGVEFESGRCVVESRLEPAHVAWFSSLEHVETVHCAGGAATLVLLD